MKQIKRVISMILTIALAIGAFSMESYVNAATTVTSLTVSTDEYVLAAGENPKDPGGNGVVTFDTSLAEHISFWAYSFSNDDIYDRMTPFEEGKSYKLCLVVDTPINGNEFANPLQLTVLMKKDDKEYCVELNMSEYVVDGSKIYYMCDYVMPKLSEVPLSPFSAATETTSGSTLNFDNSYKVTLKNPSVLQFGYQRTGYYTSEFDINIYDSNKKLIGTLSQEKTNDSKTKYTYDSETLSAGTYYIMFDKKSGSDSGVTLTIIEKESNTDPSGAKTVNLPTDDNSTKLTWTQYSSGGSKTKQCFKLVVAEKTWYNFYDYDANKGVTANIYKGDSEKGEELYKTTTLFTQDDKLFDKGTYFLVAYGAKDSETYNIPIKSRDFKDIKKIIVKDVYEVYKGKTKIQISFDPADNESSVKWSEGDQDKFYVSGYDYEEKEALPKNEAVVYAKSLGEFTSTITTSEGVSQTLKFKVVPAPTKVTKAVAETKSKKKATLKLEWTDTGNYYKIYEKGSKDKDFKLVKETADAKITLNKKPGQTLSYKIESCYKKDGKVVLSSMGSAETVMTAPNKAPSFKTLKQKGSTKYVKPYTKSYWHPATRTRAGYYETVKQGNQSNATVSVKYKKVSGAKYYQANKGNPQGISQGTDTIMYVKNKLSFTYKGKIKPKTEKIKIRAIWKKGVCTAYGPWSKTKKVKIKGNK